MKKNKKNVLDSFASCHSPFGKGQFIKKETQTALNIPYKKAIRGLTGHLLNAETFLHYNSKSVIYSFNKVKNLYPLLSKIEYLLKSFFLSMSSLISRPVYLIKHDKIIIRLFVFLSPKMEKYLDSSLIGQEGKLQGHSPTVLRGMSYNYQARKIAYQRLNKFMKFKSFRPNTVNILKTQIQLNPNFARTINTFEKILNIKNSTRYKVKNNILAMQSNIPYPKGWGASRFGSVTEPLQENRKIYPYTSFVSYFKNNLEKLSIIFSKIFKKKIEFEIIKAQLPFQDSNLLCQILGYNSNKYNFRRMLKILVPRAVIKNPSKELSYVSDSPQHKQIFGIGTVLTENRSLSFKEKDLNPLFSQPSSYLLPFFYSKFYLNFINSILLAKYRYSKGTINDRNIHRTVPLSTGPQELDNLSILSFNNIIKKHTSCFNSILKSALVNNNNFPSYLAGMNIKLAGRLMTQSIRPRLTVQNKQEGSLARVKVHFIETSRFTGKNKRGVFSFTVTISHVIKK